MWNSRIWIGWPLWFAGAALTGCAGSVTDANLPVGAAAYTTIAPVGIPAPTAYQIIATDVIALNVFDEPQLSNSSLRVDDMGYVQVPLAGQIKAAGLSPVELSNAISERLKRNYLVNPHVNVSVVEPAKRYVSVEGEVKQPGVYEISLDFTLLSALARASSPTNTAKLDQAIIMRTVNGQRMAARFNIKDIRGGAAPDPQIMNNDVVIVGYSNSRGFWQDLLKAAPLFNSFVVLGNNL